MHVTYDSSVNAAYIYVVPEATDAPHGKTVTLDAHDPVGDFVLDLDRDGRLIGIEVLDARRLLHPDTLAAART